MGFFDKVKDALTTSDAERAEKAQEAADKATQEYRETADQAKAEYRDEAKEAKERELEARQKAAEAREKAGLQAEEKVEAKAEKAEDKAAEAREKAEKAAEEREEKAASRDADKPDYRTYTVKSGDTLSGIAAQYGVDWREMARLNKLDNPDLIYPGQVFKVPNN
ncbi:LysM peptidoglycan-binding domain-containing protein [Ornithinimicrobium tianjinense]|uniref:LysM domain-containing protein n=1 Tax=Ornithinimicrobium tianjinense TaxID=1195761 RepID=A0A917BNE2_9MICO|nr:LysM peptidoglycan-binding domain-containing protein [Ornithinimicrobium tianjinense]GGF51535.1 hypothetical protein GCM10011366_19250 [Ornithinimicrobium tianjinense]